MDAIGSSRVFEPYVQVIQNANISQYFWDKSLLQPLWDYLRYNHADALRSPLFPVLISVSTYFVSCTLYMILDLMALRCAAVTRYKIHPDQPVTWDNIFKTLWQTGYNHVLFVFPATVAQWYWRPPLPLVEEAPPVSEFLIGIVSCTILFDFQYYIWHVLHHRVRWLYTTFHAIHHEFSAPFSWSTQYLSAWELISLGFWASIDAVLLQCHSLTGFAFMVAVIWISVDDHSGYDFPWALHNVIPFGLWGGTVKHDAHHQKPQYHFAPFFAHWDWLCGTHCDYKRSSAVTQRQSKKRKESET
ncbi:cholesterol 25-hydroxylase-like protein 2 [Callorhinchus milii]|uniref:Cholesterol 25-hydroxylase like 2 n=1 Tax=Callorhinchus milii TaxID=7868 RepID=V9L170_CALMI|nr:cholesterol 25-hydroxylase-like protein 2 [Callorhinchus milii]|eukprot:gi/632974253/ref/XP_007903571.1/ PREDICTED: cholesterol 25-hydroxylase-like protein 2 [Callorhinchus milii]